MDGPPLKSAPFRLIPPLMRPQPWSRESVQLPPSFYCKIMAQVLLPVLPFAAEAPLFAILRCVATVNVKAAEDRLA